MVPVPALVRFHNRGVETDLLVSRMEVVWVKGCSAQARVRSQATDLPRPQQSSQYYEQLEIKREESATTYTSGGASCGLWSAAREPRLE